jgi:hypothetical protein
MAKKNLIQINASQAEAMNSATEVLGKIINHYHLIAYAPDASKWIRAVGDVKTTQNGWVKNIDVHFEVFHNPNSLWVLKVTLKRTSEAGEPNWWWELTSALLYLPKSPEGNRACLRYEPAGHKREESFTSLVQHQFLVNVLAHELNRAFPE